MNCGVHQASKRSDLPVVILQVILWSSLPFYKRAKMMILVSKQTQGKPTFMIYGQSRRELSRPRDKPLKWGPLRTKRTEAKRLIGLKCIAEHFLQSKCQKSSIMTLPLWPWGKLPPSPALPSRRPCLWTEMNF